MYGGAGRWLGAQSAQAGRWALGHTGAGRARGRQARGQTSEHSARGAGSRQRAAAWLGAAVRSRGLAGRGSAQQGRGRRTAWAVGARPGVVLGWPWAVHSVHSAHFRSVLTRFFS